MLEAPQYRRVDVRQSTDCSLQSFSWFCVRSAILEEVSHRLRLQLAVWADWGWLQLEAMKV